MNAFAAVDTKYKEHVFGAGKLIFLACDYTAKKVVKRAEKSWQLPLREVPEYSTKAQRGWLDPRRTGREVAKRAGAR